MIANRRTMLADSTFVPPSLRLTMTDVGLRMTDHEDWSRRAGNETTQGVLMTHVARHPVEVLADGTTLVFGMSAARHRVIAMVPPPDLEDDAMQSPQAVGLDLVPVDADSSVGDGRGGAHLVLGLSSHCQAVYLFCSKLPLVWLSMAQPEGEA